MICRQTQPLHSNFSKRTAVLFCFEGDFDLLLSQGDLELLILLFLLSKCWSYRQRSPCPTFQLLRPIISENIQNTTFPELYILFFIWFYYFIKKWIDTIYSDYLSHPSTLPTCSQSPCLPFTQPTRIHTLPLNRKQRGN